MVICGCRCGRARGCCSWWRAVRDRSRHSRDLTRKELKLPEVSIAPELEAGVYASFANLWHTPDVFTLDFAALAAPPVRVEDEDGRAYTQIQTRIVSRVRIPPGQIFELMKALESQLSMWEAETGQRPGSEA